MKKHTLQDDEFESGNNVTLIALVASQKDYRIHYFMQKMADAVIKQLEPVVVEDRFYNKSSIGIENFEMILVENKSSNIPLLPKLKMADYLVACQDINVDAALKFLKQTLEPSRFIQSTFVVDKQLVTAKKLKYFDSTHFQ